MFSDKSEAWPQIYRIPFRQENVMQGNVIFHFKIKHVQ